MDQYVEELTGRNKKKHLFSKGREEEQYQKELVEITRSRSHDLVPVVADVKSLFNEFKDRPTSFKPIIDGFNRFCANIGGFNNLLGLLPSDNMYTSTLCGALRLIVKASTTKSVRPQRTNLSKQTSSNYEQVGKHMSEALNEIAEILSDTGDLHGLYKTEEMRPVVISFYLQIMLFLELALKWCVKYGPSKRFYSSTSDGGYWKELQVPFDRVKRLADRVCKIANKGGQAELRELHVNPEAFFKSAQLAFTILLSGQLNDATRSDAPRRQLLVARSAAPSIDRPDSDRLTGVVSDSEPERSIHERTEEDLMADSPSTTKGQLSSEVELTKSIVKARLYARQAFSSIVEDWDEQGDLERVLTWRKGPAESGLRGDLQERINRGTMSSRASLLWVRSGKPTSRINPLSNISTNIALAAQRAGMPVLLHFCDLHLQEPESCSLIEAAMMSLLIQVFEWLEALPPVGTEPQKILKTFGSKRFENAMESPEALCELLSKAIALLPQPPVIILDLLGRYRNDADELDLLLDLLLDLVPRGGSSTKGIAGACKVFITTQGECEALNEAIPQKYTYYWTVARGSAMARRRSDRLYDFGKIEDSDSGGDSSEDSVEDGGDAQGSSASNDE